jgi:hypothetical protein
VVGREAIVRVDGSAVEPYLEVRAVAGRGAGGVGPADDPALDDGLTERDEDLRVAA